MLGAFASAALIQTAASSAGSSLRYVAPFWLVAALLFLASLIPAGALPRDALIVLSVPFQTDLFTHEPATLVLLGLLALTCGVQNNLFLVEKNLVFRTTHLTGTTSDLATHLARIIFKVHSNPEHHWFEIRLAIIRTLTILAFFAGAAAGFLAYRSLGRYALVLPLGNACAIALFVTIYFYFNPHITFKKKLARHAPAQGPAQDKVTP